MTMIAYAFLQSRRLKAARTKEKSQDHHQPSMPAHHGRAILDLFVRLPPLQCPHCKAFLTEAAKPKVLK